MPIRQNIHFLPLSHDDVGSTFRRTVAAVHQGANQAVSNSRFNLRRGAIARVSEAIAANRVRRVNGEIKFQDLLEFFQGSGAILSPGRSSRLVRSEEHTSELQS